MIDEELERYLAATSARAVAPMIVALHERAEAVRRAELERFRGRLAGLDDAQAEAVEALTRGIVGQAPARARRSTSRTPPGRRPGERLGRPLRELFALEGDEPADRSCPRPGRHPGQPAGPLAGRPRGRAAAGADPDLQVELVLVETRATAASTCRSGRSAARACSSRRCRPRCSTGGADLAVHSRQGPALRPRCPGWSWPSVPERGDPRDVLVGSTWPALPRGAGGHGFVAPPGASCCATGPTSASSGLRGNMQTRLASAADGGPIVMAAAALDRLGLGDAIAERLDVATMLPQVAQGALAVECRADDDDARSSLAAIEDPAARRCVDAERAFLAELGGDC